MEQQVNILGATILSEEWHKLIQYELELKLDDKSHRMTREVLKTSNGAAILLYNKEAKTVILTQQFRLPVYLMENQNGNSLEVCAGELEDENPEDAIRRETEEETGYTIGQPKKVFEVLMMPATVSEILYCFIATYDQSMKTGKGGGKKNEEEYIKVLELPFTDAIEKINSGEIRDGKTILLLQYALINNIFAY